VSTREGYKFTVNLYIFMVIMARVILAFPLVLLTFALVSSEKQVQVESVCDTQDPVAVIQRTDECIVDPVIKESISRCRQFAYGSSNPKEAAEKFCPADPMARSLMDDLFNDCLTSRGMEPESIQVEFVANCGFCSNIQLVNKTEECFVSKANEKVWFNI